MPVSDCSRRSWLVGLLVAASAAPLMAGAPGAVSLPLALTLTSSEPLSMLLLGCALAAVATLLRSLSAARE